MRTKKQKQKRGRPPYLVIAKCLIGGHCDVIAGESGIRGALVGDLGGEERRREGGAKISGFKSSAEAAKRSNQVYDGSGMKKGLCHLRHSAESVFVRTKHKDVSAFVSA